MNSMSNIPQFYQDIMQRSPFAAAVAAAQLSNFAHHQQQQQQQQQHQQQQQQIHKMNPYQQFAQFNPVALAALTQQFQKNPQFINTQNQVPTKRGRPPRRLDLAQNRSRSRSPHSNSSTTSGNKSLTTRTSTPSKLEEKEEEEESIITEHEEIEDLDEDEIDIDEIEEEEYIDTESDLNTTTTSTKSAKKFKKEDESKLTPPQAGPVYDFTLQALEMSLYGYLRQTDPMFMGHAISGLRYYVAAQQQQLQNKLNEEQNKQENLSSSSSSSSSPKTNKKTSFAIDDLLTSSSSSSSSSSSPAIVPTAVAAAAATPTKLDIDKIELPDGLQIRAVYLHDSVHYGVFCKKTVIPKNTRFGPYPGKSVNSSELNKHDDHNNLWELYNDGKLAQFLDPKQPTTSASLAKSSTQWMVYVNCARFAQEQNLIAVQSEGEIYYEVCKDIAQGQELLVWYGDTYLQFMGIPVSLKDMTDELNENESDENKDGYTCDRCGKVFAYKYYRDKHLKYTRCVDQGDRKFPCHLCTRSFEKRDRLRIHILHVHEKHRPHKCTVCSKSFSQSSSLNKHMRVHSGERPYKCVYCNKAFTASSILRTHIRQHSGEKPFKCKYCGKAFASHAAHDSHVRRTHCINKEKEANLIL